MSGLVPPGQNGRDRLLGTGERAVEAAVLDRELGQIGTADVLNPVAVWCDVDRVALQGEAGGQAGLEGCGGHGATMLPNGDLGEG
jgi:hypothetical protein